MNRSQDEAHLAVEKARDALRNNRRSDARQWAERAASLAPQMEDPWLILAAIANPRDSLDYIHKALAINPGSPRARKGMQWARQRLQEQAERQPAPVDTPRSPAGSLPAAASQPSPSVAPSRPAGRSRSLMPIVLVAIGLVVFAVAAVSAARSPVVASLIQQAEPTHAPSWALVDIPKPTYTPDFSVAVDIQPTATVEAVPTASEEVPNDAASPTEQPTEVPTDQPTSEPPTAEPTWSGSLSLAYVDDTPTAPAPAGMPVPAPGDSTGGAHWIDVNLSQQTVYAYAGDQLMNSFLVSTGTWLHPTVTGKYHVYIKLRYTDMSGPDYYLPNVPYTMYFFRGYGLHGTYWHHNFGTPMSHGCVNLSIPDAEWLYNFSSVGTLVNVHY